MGTVVVGIAVSHYQLQLIQEVARTALLEKKSLLAQAPLCGLGFSFHNHDPLELLALGFSKADLLLSTMSSFLNPNSVFASDYS